MDDKVSIVVLKVNLQCPCCYKKVKRIICKIPQIRDQVYKEKENKVIITIISSNPEKIGDRLCFKGAKVIKGIKFVDPHKLEKPKQPEKSKEPEKPKVFVIEEPEKPNKNVTFVDPPNEPNHDG